MKIFKVISRLFFLYVVAIICAPLLGMFAYVFCIFTAIYRLATVTKIICFLAMPIGSALGMYLLDKWIYKPPTYFIWRMLTAVLISVGGFTLIAVNISQDRRDLLLSPLPSELYLHFLIIGFFSLTGYVLAGLIENWRLKSQPSQYGSNMNNAHRNILAMMLKIMGVVLFFGFLAVLAVAGLFVVTPPEAEIEAAAVEKFFQEFLASMISDTDFYKKNSSESAVQNINDSRRLFSNSYDDYRDRCQRGYYEYSIVFDSKYLCKVKIEGTNRNFVVSSFEYGGITQKLSFSDPRPRRKGEAMKFYKKILASVNNETDFYKKCSDEAAIQQIQAHRSMISSNDILAYRKTEGEWEDFYFYTVFDEEHVFEVHVNYSEKGLRVKNFTYIGKNDGKWKIRGLENVSH